ncbi:hypothetical protein D3C85_662420 [compost metagenome]
MAITNAASSQMSLMDQLGALLGLNDNGERGNLDTGMTVPTAYNTSASWVPPGAAPNPAAGASNGLGTGLGVNIGTGQLALGGLGSLAGIIGSNRQFGLAKDQLKFQKDFANTNLNNSIKSYNTTLEDRLNARGFAQGDSTAATQEQIARNRLSR